MPGTTMPDHAASSVSDREIAHFDQLAATWWDPKGPMKPLHDMNPMRTEWVNAHLKRLTALRGGTLSLLDIGCGAGLASEAYARMGHDVLGLDASPEGIRAAEAHLADHPLPQNAGTLTYRNGSAETLLTEGQSFDAVSALEVIEHVNDPQEFLSMLRGLTKPGGLVAVSTLNRTLASLAVAKIGAEYIARLLPVGTHDWQKFIRPDELHKMGRAAGLRMIDVAGMSYRPMHWRITRDTSINYITMFVRD
ncbi:bifunctional 2-polyprenyl-6-hydroxyphenol methylase/3-demethylubiquinol 3-O-methyltransferase UbiG [Asaia lannensis]|uniref:Ubiquinone biosynthesis O-methyltransferase n=1 Tax=Asaia lannensis NBRC 102526 TaxID=1307926 RepID=A0ABT1CF97_9PROT|nr:bifunctional 2-polyprenyl-6-hydroxyphenol methylase/3-demethylubiquinol 3-O-methyltransferase UbiG [Asaia lannensis]MCO6159537.1 bifunctional 2-polyprenyl-6-hydroxyphenol methylase/3-demethylubiquinol 3-O-methyltransferase UbiG [Asaia lannensis NBRC 102526]